MASSPPLSRTALIRELPFKLKEDDVRRYFEKQEIGGPIENYVSDLNGNKSEALVTFRDASSAQRILKMRTHWLKASRFNVIPICQQVCTKVRITVNADFKAAFTTEQWEKTADQVRKNSQCKVEYTSEGYTVVGTPENIKEAVAILEEAQKEILMPIFSALEEPLINKKSVEDPSSSSLIDSAVPAGGPSPLQPSPPRKDKKFPSQRIEGGADDNETLSQNSNSQGNMKAGAKKVKSDGSIKAKATHPSQASSTANDDVSGMKRILIKEKDIWQLIIKTQFPMIKRIEDQNEVSVTSTYDEEEAIIEVKSTTSDSSKLKSAVDKIESVYQQNEEKVSIQSANISYDSDIDFEDMQLKIGLVIGEIEILYSNIVITKEVSKVTFIGGNYIAVAAKEDFEEMLNLELKNKKSKNVSSKSYSVNAGRNAAYTGISNDQRLNQPTQGATAAVGGTAYPSKRDTDDAGDEADPQEKFYSMTAQSGSDTKPENSVEGDLEATKSKADEPKDEPTGTLKETIIKEHKTPQTSKRRVIGK